MKQDFKLLGTFEVTSGQIMVSDPCYHEGSTILNAKYGTWEAKVVYSYKDHGRVKELYAYHKDHPRGIYFNNYQVGVDSGQMSVSDLQYYNDNVASNGWYEKICKLTLNRDQGGVFEQICASSTGYGDGGYDLMVNEVDGLVVGVMIDFIPEVESDEEYDEDYED